ncbi:hypothetical protein SADUNF_Sadunf06G0013200 [Salix dunnii]|uniref:Uncharacterized protein n=1 Tax=Salix dunnii TaxID=1413687 RepID=A0A835K0C3_9ROSI|nr:hypothetical protein SADUNF_Sadunf06G0013200 [Salix dunnii]
MEVTMRGWGCIRNSHSNCSQLSIEPNSKSMTLYFTMRSQSILTLLQVSTNGVTCGIIFGASFHAPIAFKIDDSLRVDLVCAYSLVMDLVSNGKVEESSMIYR